MVLLIAGVSNCQGDEYCMRIYRSDIMQRWAVKNGSPLCDIDKPAFGSSNHIGIKRILNKDEFQINLHGSDPHSLTYHWRTPSTEIGGQFGVAYYNPNYSYPQILRFNDTNRISNAMTFIHETKDGIAGFNRTTLLVLSGDLTIEDGTYNGFINCAALVLGIGVFLGLGVRTREYYPASSAISIVTLGAAFGETHLQLSDTGLLIVFLVALHAVAMGVGFSLRYRLKSIAPWISVSLALLQAALLAANYRRSWPTIICSLIMAVTPLILGVLMHLLNIQKVLNIFGGIGCLFVAGAMAIPVVAVDYPAAFYQEALSDRRRYIYMTIEERFMKLVYGLIIGVSLLIAEFIVCLLTKKKIEEEATATLKTEGYFEAATN